MGEFPNPATQFKPGNNVNAEGRNQYTYRREAEKHLEEWCVEYGRDMVRVIANAARAGKPWAAKLILDRVLPAVTQHEVALSEATAASTILDKLTRIVELKRANGGDREPEPERADGGNGDIP